LKHHPFYADGFALLCCLRNNPIPDVLLAVIADTESFEGQEAARQLKVCCAFAELLHSRGMHDAQKGENDKITYRESDERLGESLCSPPSGD